MTDEEIIEELLWIAYEKGLGIQLAELAGSKMKNGNLDKMVAYDEAYQELGLGE
jgi:hypothetical protein